MPHATSMALTVKDSGGYSQVNFPPAVYKHKRVVLPFLEDGGLCPFPSFSHQVKPENTEDHLKDRQNSQL